MKKTILLLSLSILAAVASGRASQNAPTTPDQAEDAYIDSLRADLRADKTTLITEAMQFSEKDAAAFWPVYKKYDAEVVKLNDERIRLIKTYSDTWMTMTDADAKQMAQKSLELEARRADLKKKYFAEFSKVLPGLTVAKFVQLEHRLDLLVDLKIASDLPALLVRSSGGSGQPK
jgi:hypothetical protein